MTNPREAHQQNLDAAQREIDQRNADGEDTSRLRVNPVTYAIETVSLEELDRQARGRHVFLRSMTRPARRRYMDE